MRRLLVLLFALAASGATAATAHADVNTQEILWLDFHAPANTGAAGPVTTSGPLAAGRFYVAITTGTLSGWGANRWESGAVCGTPDAAPMFASPGVTPAPAGADSELAWAEPLTRQFCPKIPHSYTSFVMDWGNGHGFVHRTANGGPYSAPQPGHTYTYLLNGNGVPASFKLLDKNTQDDDGLLRVVVRPAVKSECNGIAACESTAPDVPPPPLPDATPPGTTPGNGGTQSNPLGSLPSTTTSTTTTSSISCPANRRFRLRFTVPKGNAIRSVRVTVGGRRETVSLRAVKHHPRVRIAAFKTRRSSHAVTTVRLTVRLRHGHAMRRTVHYRRCASGRVRKV